MRAPLRILGAAALAIASIAFAADRDRSHSVVLDGHQRLLPLQGGQNFRDLGGYRTTSGRTTRWGVLFRSGSMHDLTPADFAYLERIGIRTVCDFRSTSERRSAPVSWPPAHAPTVLSDDYENERSEMLSSVPGQIKTGADARAQIAASYPKLLVRYNRQYRRMFGELLAGRVPLAFNCTAGKDRTGIAAALILTALGVPRATVVEDYLLTNRYLDVNKAASMNPELAERLHRLPPDVLKAYSDADSSYIAAVFQALDNHRGGVRGYLKDELGLSVTDLTKLRNMYTI